MPTFLGVCVLLHTLYFMPFNPLTVKVKMDIIEISKTDKLSVIEKVRAITNANEKIKLKRQD